MACHLGSLWMSKGAWQPWPTQKSPPNLKFSRHLPAPERKMNTWGSMAASWGILAPLRHPLPGPRASVAIRVWTLLPPSESFKVASGDRAWGGKKETSSLPCLKSPFNVLGLQQQTAHYEAIGHCPLLEYEALIMSEQHLPTPRTNHQQPCGAGTASPTPTGLQPRGEAAQWGGRAVSPMRISCFLFHNILG
jgi:hypothetical protein